MNPILKKQFGFTLIEAMIAMVILAFAAVSIILPFTTAADVQAEASRRALATKLAADKLEELMTENFADIENESEVQGAIKNANGSVFTDPMYDNFSRSVTCKNAQVGGVNLLWVTVDVQYLGKLSASLGTLIGP